MSKDEEPKQELDQALSLKLYSPYKVYFNDIVDNISAVNKTGDFDILSGHHNFMTLLEKCEITVRQQGRSQKFEVTRGVMHVKKNKITVFLDI